LSLPFDRLTALSDVEGWCPVKEDREKELHVFKKGIRAPILAFFLLSAGGLLLHLRLHTPGLLQPLLGIPPTSAPAANWVPLTFGLLGTFVLPFLFNSDRTVAWAYLVTWLAVVVGTGGMAHYTIVHWQGPVSLKAVLLQSTLADILVLTAKLPLAHIILRHFTARGQA
jgi:hypothetical protein